MYSTNLILRLRDKKKERRFTNAEIAERSSVPLSTVNKILGGHSKYPRQENVEAIAIALGMEMLDYTTEANGKTLMVRDASARYQTSQPEDTWHTVVDYYNLPDDFRAELIDGEIIEMTAPTVNHQLILSELAFQITRYLREEGSTCQGFPAPFDVQLDKDQYTMVQPDYVVICDRSKYENGKNCYGAPDLVIEITSPSSDFKDHYLKHSKYARAGVKEYWIVDTNLKRVIVFSLFRNRTTIYTFDDVVSSILFKELSIDFSEILAMMIPD